VILRTGDTGALAGFVERFDFTGWGAVAPGQTIVGMPLPFAVAPDTAIVVSTVRGFPLGTFGFGICAAGDGQGPGLLLFAFNVTAGPIVVPSVHYGITALDSPNLRRGVP